MRPQGLDLTGAVQLNPFEVASVRVVLVGPPGETRAELLTATYMVVLFSVVVQGSTVGFAARRLTRRAAREQAEAVASPS